MRETAFPRRSITKPRRSITSFPLHYNLAPFLPLLDPAEAANRKTRFLELESNIGVATSENGLADSIPER